jgi:hypothetical protein
VTTMSGMDIKDFLLARIAEDEAEANWIDAEGDNGSSPIQHPTRIQAECAFKRWLIGTYSGTREAYLLFRAMATVYSDHPDYREDWQP